MKTNGGRHGCDYLWCIGWYLSLLSSFCVFLPVLHVTVVFPEREGLICHTFQCSFIVPPPLPLYTEVPDAPFNVTITNNSQRSQVLSWVAPFDGNRPITQYVIYVSSSRQPSLTQIHPPLGGGRTRRQTAGDSTDPVPSVTVTDDPTTVIVSDLIPFVEYSYTVQAINEVGRSDMSQPSQQVPFVMTEAAGESEEEQYIPLYSTLLVMLCSHCTYLDKWCQCFS